MNQINKCKEDIIKYSKLCYERGLVSAAGGNISARCDDVIIMTATGISLRDTDFDNLILCNIDGDVLDQPITDLRPSKEKGLHLQIYKARPDVKSVIHVHPPYVTGYSVCNSSFPLVTVSAEMKLKKLLYIAKMNPGSEELAGMVGNAVSSTEEFVKCIILQNHGIITYDTNMSSCFDIAELVEDTAHIAFISNTLSYSILHTVQTYNNG